MDKVTAVRRHLNREKWKTLITECRTSGMSVAKWCKANGICEQTYYKNLKKLREEMIQYTSLIMPLLTFRPKYDCPTLFRKRFKKRRSAIRASLC